MSKYDTRPFFVKALKKELARLGRGGQAQIARYSGISKSLLSDIISGRTFGAEEKRRSIAAALGYEDYEAFLDVGRRLMKAAPVRQSPLKNPKESRPDELMELLRENRQLRIDLDQARRQIEQLRNQIEGIGRSREPSVPDTPAAPAVKSPGESS